MAVSGTIVMYKVDKGFGFAKKDGAKEGDKDVWFGVKSWKHRVAYEKLKPGIRVHFDTETDEGKLKERAINMTAEIPEDEDDGVDKELKGKREKKKKPKPDSTTNSNPDKEFKSKRFLGKITYYSKGKGYGFAKKDGDPEDAKDVWFGVKSLKHHYFHPNFRVHTPVEFEIEMGDDGRERALRMTGPGGGKVEIHIRSRKNKKGQQDDDNSDGENEDLDSDEIDEVAEDSESEEVQVKKNKVAPKRKMDEKPKSFKKPAFAGETGGKEDKSKTLPPKKKRKIVLGFNGDDSIAQPKSKKKAAKLMKKA